MASSKKTVAEMFGELFREVAVLVGVFLPLDMLYSERPISKTLLGFGFAIFVLCFFLGVGIEALRKP